MSIKRIKGIVFWVSICFILYWVITGLLGLFILIEWSNPELRTEYFKVRLFGFPIALFFVFISSIKKTEEVSNIIAKIVVGIMLPLFTLFVLFISDMCQYQYSELFTDKNDSRLKIIKRSLDCGATDTEPPNWKFYKKIPLTDYFTFYSKVDISEIDKNKWIQNR